VENCNHIVKEFCQLSSFNNYFLLVDFLLDIVCARANKSHSRDFLANLYNASPMKERWVEQAKKYETWETTTFPLPSPRQVSLRGLQPLEGLWQRILQCTPKHWSDILTAKANAILKAPASTFKAPTVFNFHGTTYAHKMPDSWAQALLLSPP
jgi:hypothetical protein